MFTANGRQTQYKLCKKRLSCTACEEKYPKPLHDFISKNKKVTNDGNKSQNYHEKVKINFICNVKCASTLGKPESMVISRCIVPVRIKYENILKQIIICTMLDNSSQFAYETVFKQIGV